MASTDSDDDAGRKRKLVIGSGLLAVAVGFLAYNFVGGTGVVAASDARAFYTVDDGATTFVDVANKPTPFDHGGKQAVEAIVFASPGGSGRAVGYLRRLSPTAKKQADRDARTATPGNVIEVKVPGAPKWVSVNSADGMKVVREARPKGEAVEQVVP